VGGGVYCNKFNKVSTYKDGYKDGEECEYHCTSKSHKDKICNDVLKRLISKDFDTLNDDDKDTFFNGYTYIICTKKVYKNLGKDVTLTSYKFSQEKSIVIKREGDDIKVKVYREVYRSGIRILYKNIKTQYMRFNYDVVDGDYTFKAFGFELVGKTRTYEPMLDKDKNITNYMVYEGDLRGRVDNYYHCNNYDITLNGEERRWNVGDNDGEGDIRYNIASIHRYDEETNTGHISNYRDGIFFNEGTYWEKCHMFFNVFTNECHRDIICLLKKI
jgi:hypothetical protein